MIQRKRNRKRNGGKIFAATGGSSSVGSACSGFAALSRRTPPRWLAYEGVRGSWLTKTFRWKTRRQAVPMEHRRLTIELSGLDSRDSNKDRIRRGAGCQSVRRGRRTSASSCVIPLFIRTPPGSQANRRRSVVWFGVHVSRLRGEPDLRKSQDEQQQEQVFCSRSDPTAISNYHGVVVEGIIDIGQSLIDV